MPSRGPGPTPEPVQVWLRFLRFFIRVAMGRHPASFGRKRLKDWAERAPVPAARTCVPPRVSPRINGYRGRFGMYLPPLLEALGLAEVTHDPRNNRMRAI